jgi:two-component system sensor histidine kinase KdpD
MPTLDPRSLRRLIIVAVPSLAGATALVWLLEDGLRIPNASAVYLVAVVATALLSGTLGALASAIAGILLYDYLFTQPLHTLVINDPDEWLSLVLLLFVGLVVGQLAAVQRSRTEVAETAEREARELFRVSRVLATRRSTPAVLPELTGVLAVATGMDRVWIALGRDDARERVAAESSPAGEAATAVAAGPHEVLRRTPGDEPAQWVRVHPPAAGRVRPSRERLATFRVRIEAGGEALGSIWGDLERRRGAPDRTSTRLLAAAADQIGQALAQDRLAAEAQAAEISRQSDALKSALLQSVSHDLRTPLAAIRAAAGTLRPDSALDDAGRRASADAIELEVGRLDRLVANLLDLSRIEAGALRAERDVFELDDIVGRTVERFASRFDGRAVSVELAPEPVQVDPIFLDEIVTNLLENALKFAPLEAPVRLRSAPADAEGFVRLTVEDGGTGVAPESLDRIFEAFYRAGASAVRASRQGSGIGLAVVRGLAEAMGARVSARASELGGLAVDLDLPAAPLPAELTGASHSGSPADAAT